MKKIQLFTLLVLLASVIPSSAASWVVSYGQSLQAAISNAAAGDNITVMSGTYNENIAFGKGLTIQGSGGAVLVTGTLIVTNATLPVYISDIQFGRDGNSGIAINNCQSARMDRCSLVGGGDFNGSSNVFYCYKNTFSGSVNINLCTLTMQRCNVAGNLNSSNSTTKFIASVIAGRINHSAGEITVFQSTLNGDPNVFNFNPTDKAWICYNFISYRTEVRSGNLQFVGNRVWPNPNNIGWNILFLGSGGVATVRNNIFGRNWHANGWAIAVNSDAGPVSIINNTAFETYNFIRVYGSPGGVQIRGNIHWKSGDSGGWSVYTDTSQTIVDHNNFCAGINQGVQTGTINQNPELINLGYWNFNCFNLSPSSPCINTGPTVDATFINFDGTTNTMGAYGGHSYDPTGLTTTNPVVLSGSVTPLYVKKGQAVTVSARAAVVAAP